MLWVQVRGDRPFDLAIERAGAVLNPALSAFKNPPLPVWVVGGIGIGVGPFSTPEPSKKLAVCFAPSRLAKSSAEFHVPSLKMKSCGPRSPAPGAAASASRPG